MATFMKSKNFNWLLTIFVAILTFSALLLLSSRNLSATTSNSQVTASVNVPGTLYTDISPTSITWKNYPTLANDTNTSITVNDQNGNIPGNIFIWGTATLSNTLNGNSIAIGNVLWNPTSSNAFVGNPVTTSPVNTLIVVAAPTLSSQTTNSPIYLGVRIPAGTPSGSYKGNIYFEIENVSGSNTIYSLQPSSNTLSVTVNVLSTCYISLSPNSINFGTLATGTTSTTWNGITDTDNGGNAQATIYVYGGNWIFSSNTAISFYVANTVWSGTNTVSYSSGTPLTLTPVSTGIIVPAPTQSNPSTSNTVYFEVAVPGGAPVGAYTQNIVIANQC